MSEFARSGQINPDSVDEKYIPNCPEQRVLVRAAPLAVEENKKATRTNAAILKRSTRKMIRRVLSLDNAEIRECFHPLSSLQVNVTIGAAANVEMQSITADREHRIRTERDEVKPSA